MEKYQQGINLVNEGKIDEAYDYFQKLTLDNPNDEEALYLKIQIMEFKEMDLNLILSEYQHLIKISKNINQDIYYKISIIFNRLERYDEAINYAQKGINGDNQLSISCRYNIAVAYFCKGGNHNVKKALDVINECISLAEEPNDLEYYFYLKADILCYLGKISETNQLINDFFFRMGNTKSVKKLEARININLDSIEVEKNPKYQREYLVKAKEALTIYLETNATDYELWKKLYDIDLDLFEYEDALLIIERLNDEEIVDLKVYISEKFFLVSKISGSFGIKKLYESFKQNYPDNFLVPYCTAYYLDVYVKTKEDYQELSRYAEEAYQLAKNNDTLELLVYANRMLKKVEENVNIIKQYIDEYSSNSYAYHLLASAYHNANYDYDLIETTENKSFKLAKTDLLTHFFNIDGIMKNPSVIKKAIKKIPYDYINNQYNTRKLIISFAYGLNYPKIDFKIALKLIEKQEQEQFSLQCLYGLKGRMYELIKNDYAKAFEYYQKSYDLFLKDDSLDKCTCSVAYLAHAYLLGIGIPKDEKIAIKLIVDAINDYDEDAGGNVIYLYAYLYLTDKIEADYHKVIQLLRMTKAFNRYEISREILIDQICKKVGISNTYAVSDMKSTLKYDSVLAKKYHKKAKKAKFYYPFLNSY